ncbi:MAG: signal recognition particle protein Srp19 [Candidatus Thermoplasmatota archaeon]|nr:signal recognition particle protein Srp19 [Candidatus Thermoplasmatota archaeon]
MVSKDDHKLIIWPIYFEKNISRSKGRKIAKKFSLEKPDVEKIAKAAKTLGLSPIIEKNASHPYRSWKKEGRVIIDNNDTKSKIIFQIAKMI